MISQTISIYLVLVLGLGTSLGYFPHRGTLFAPQKDFFQPLEKTPKSVRAPMFGNSQVSLET